MLEIIREKSIEGSIKLSRKKKELMNRAKNYVNNQRGDIPVWGQIAIGLIIVAIVLTIVVLVFNWLKANVESTTDHIDSENSKWLK